MRITERTPTPLEDIIEFMKVFNGGYFVEWFCGAGLSADSLRSYHHKMIWE